MTEALYFLSFAVVSLYMYGMLEVFYDETPRPFVLRIFRRFGWLGMTAWVVIVTQVLDANRMNWYMVALYAFLIVSYASTWVWSLLSPRLRARIEA